ncbi:MAG: HDOD domain-containing protein [Planctomyces sp.]|nr:HDOD domain-containing protein [Planctomyces sp.]
MNAPLDSLPTARRPKLSSLPMLPAMTVEILRLVEDPASTIDDLNRVISRDPSLSCRLLKVVNSSFYGLSRQVASVSRAISILGLQATRNLAIVASMVKIFEVGGHSELHRTLVENLWRHATATAAAAKLVADTLRFGRADELFLAGLIHDVGIIGELHSDRTRFLDAVKMCGPDADGNPQRNLMDAEVELFGDEHSSFGGMLCEEWRFPNSLCEIVGNHHRPLDVCSSNRGSTCLIAIADIMAAGLPAGFRLDYLALDCPDTLLEEVRLDRKDYDEIRERLVREVDEITAVFS